MHRANVRDSTRQGHAMLRCPIVAASPEGRRSGGSISAKDRLWIDLVPAPDDVIRAHQCLLELRIIRIHLQDHLFIRENVQKSDALADFTRRHPVMKSETNP